METTPKNVSTTETGKFASLMPTNGPELVQAWELRPEDWSNESVKVSRCIPGTNRTELLMSCPLEEYDLAEIVREFGPMTYRITPGPGPNARKMCTISVSPHYARRAGWNERPPVYSPSEVMATRTFAQAQQGPVDQVALGQMIELAVLKAKAQDQRPDNGMDALTLMMKGFQLAGELEMKALDRIKALAGLPTSDVPREPASLGDVLLQMGPKILDTIQTIVAKPAPPQAPMPRNPGISSQPLALPETARAIPQETPQVMPNPSIQLPEITEEEKIAIAPILGVMRTYIDKLMPYVQSPIPANVLAGQLRGYIGPDLEMPVLALAGCMERVGPGVLGAIHPGLANERGAGIMRGLAKCLQDEMDGQERFPSEEN